MSALAAWERLIRSTPLPSSALRAKRYSRKKFGRGRFHTARHVWPTCVPAALEQASSPFVLFLPVAQLYCRFLSAIRDLPHELASFSLLRVLSPLASWLV